MHGVFTLLGHEKMVVTFRGDLRLMGDDQHLRRTTQLRQQFANDFGNPTPDAHVDFVKDHGWRSGDIRRDNLQCEADSRQFAA